MVICRVTELRFPLPLAGDGRNIDCGCSFLWKVHTSSVTKTENLHTNSTITLQNKQCMMLRATMQLAVAD